MASLRVTFEVKMQAVLLKFFSSSGVLCTFFAIANQLPGFSTCGLPNVEDF